MIDTKILLSVVIVILIGAAAAGYQMTTTTPGLWQPVTSQNPTTTDDDGSGTTPTNTYSTGQGGSQTGGSLVQGTGTGAGTGTGGVGVKITATEAKAIAQKSIAQAGAEAGTPKLVTLNNTLTYVVPIMLNNEQVGEIEIDPQTGKVIGGAGGVSSG